VVETECNRWIWGVLGGTLWDWGLGRFGFVPGVTLDQRQAAGVSTGTGVGLGGILC
jgi:hypothetical protein